MAMLGRTTSVTLLYVERPNLDFAECRAFLEGALRRFGHEGIEPVHGADDYVTMDVEGSRVVLGYAELEARARGAETAPGGYAAALLVSVGPSPRRDGSRDLARNGHALCDMVIEEVRRKRGPDLILWNEIEGVFAEKQFEALIDAAQAMRPARLPPELEAALKGHAPRRAEMRPAMAFEPAQVMESLAPPPPLSSVAAASGAASDTVPADPAWIPANDHPTDMLDPMREEMARIREALYPPEEEQRQASPSPRREKEPLVRRLTTYSFNTTLLVVAMPIGAALLTYNVLGREDSRVTARVMALTGIGMAFSKLVFHGHIPHLGA